MTQELNTDSLPQRLGVPYATRWIEENTDSKDSFLVASTGYSRVWAMYTNRTIVFLSSEVNGIRLPNENIGINELLQVSIRWNVSYVILDSTTPWLFEQLSPLYRPKDTKVGQIMSINTTIGKALRVIYAEGSPFVVILHLIDTLESNLWRVEYDQSTEKPEIFLNGSAVVENGWLRISTPPYHSLDKVYGKYGPMNLKLPERSMAIYRANVSISSKAGLYILFADGEWVLSVSNSSGVTTVDLSKYSGKIVDTILIYNLLKEPYRNTPPSYNVYYDYVRIVLLDFS